MLIKLPDGMWVDPKEVKAVYVGDEDAVYLDMNNDADYPVFPRDCKRFESDDEIPLQALADVIANSINEALKKGGERDAVR